jgi:hypothetical protein
MLLKLMLAVLIFAAVVFAVTPLASHLRLPIALRLPLVMLIFAAILTFLSVLLRPRSFTPKGVAQIDERNSRLRDHGVEPLSHSKKMLNFFGFLLIWAPLSFLVVVNLDYRGNVAVFLLVVSSTVGIFLSALAFFVGDKAEEAGRGWISFFWLTMVLSPLVTWIIVLVLKPVSVSSSKYPEPPAPIATKLAELLELQEKGLISPDEFEKAKKRALGI